MYDITYDENVKKNLELISNIMGEEIIFPDRFGQKLTFILKEKSIRYELSPKQGFFNFLRNNQENNILLFTEKVGGEISSCLIFPFENNYVFYVNGVCAGNISKDEYDNILNNRDHIRFKNNPYLFTYKLYFTEKKYHEMTLKNFMRTDIIHYEIDKELQKIINKTEHELRQAFYHKKMKLIDYKYENFIFKFSGNILLVTEKTNKIEHLVGGIYGGTRWIDLNYREKNIGSHMILAEEKSGTKMLFPTSYSIGGAISRVKAHKMAIENALKEDKTVPKNVMGEYNSNIHESKICEIKQKAKEFSEKGIFTGDRPETLNSLNFKS